MKYNNNIRITERAFAHPNISGGNQNISAEAARCFSSEKDSIQHKETEISGNELELLDALLAAKLGPAIRKRTIADLSGSFSSLRQIVYAPKRMLLGITKKGAVAHEELQKFRKLAVALAKVELNDVPVISQYSELIKYCRTVLAGDCREHFYVLFLDKAKKLIRSECLASGTIDHVTVYPRELFNKALEYSASSVILVHNHPSGMAKPSRADVDMTKKLAMVGHYLGIPLTDHLIIGSGDTYSFRLAKSKASKHKKELIPAKLAFDCDHDNEHKIPW